MDWIKSPISWVENLTLYVSIPFTWDLPRVRTLARQRAFFWDRLVVGGTATRLCPDYFDDLPEVTVVQTMPGVLRRCNPLATRTSAGCDRNCGFCGVKHISPELIEFEEWDDLPVLVDDNLLATSQSHFDKVIDRLIRWGWADFNQGLDARLLTSYHAARIAEIKKPMVRLALDSMAYADEWQRAVDTLRTAGIAKSRLRSYALVGYHDRPADAWQRCQFVEQSVDKVLPMWYHPLDTLVYNGITDEQAACGWNQRERVELFSWFYKHTRIS